MLCAALGAVQAETPDRFIDYVEATGKQYIDTGIQCSDTMKVEIQFEWTALKFDGCLIGCRTDDNHTRFYMVHNNNGKPGYGFYTFTTLNDSQWEAYRRYWVTTEFKKDGENTQLSMKLGDGTVLANTTTNATFNPGINLYLFAANYKGPQHYVVARCYSCKIWKNGSLAAELRPCLKDGRAGLYDNKTKTILYPQGEDFKINTDPRRDEPDYFVDYVQSSGSQYIDTGVPAKSGLSMDTTMAWVSVPGDGCYLGARKSDERIYLYHYYQSQMLGYGEYRPYQSEVTATAGDKRHVEAVLKAGEQKLIVNGTTIVEETNSQEYDTGLNLYLFANHHNSEDKNKSAARCYGLKIWQTVGDEKNLVRDFRPCVKNGRGCLYDKESGQIFYPQGGDLEYPELTEEDFRPVCRLEYVDTDGKQYIDLGVRSKAGTAAQFRMAWLDGNIDAGFLGAKTTADKSINDRFYMWHTGYDYSNKTYWMAWGYNSFSWTKVPVEVGQVYSVYSAFLRDSITIRVGGTEIDSASSGPYTRDSDLNLYLFAQNVAGTADYYAKARCYSLKIWQDDVQVRDLKPVRLKCGIPALWDRRDGAIYRPAVGKLIAGPEAEGPLEPGTMLILR